MPRPAEPARALLVAWIAFVALLALLPLGSVAARDPVVWVALVPFDAIVHALGRGLTPATIVSVPGNVVAFVPIGLLAPMALPGSRSWRAILALGIGVSLGIELAQLAISIAIGVPYRRADVDDVILNGLGTAIGYGAWRLVPLGRRRAPARSG